MGFNLALKGLILRFRKYCFHTSRYSLSWHCFEGSLW